MRRCLGYTKYLLLHKWYTLIECFNYGLYWRGIIHDLSKFRSKEFIPSMLFFYDSSGRKIYRNIHGTVSSKDLTDNFEISRLTHQGSNDHHWQHWVLFLDSGEIKPCEMSTNSMYEMIADWKGTARAQGVLGVKSWYTYFGDTLLLHPVTRKKVEEILKKGGNL